MSESYLPFKDWSPHRTLQGAAVMGVGGTGTIVTAPLTLDLVNHPPHYQGDGIEVIDVIEAFSLGYHLGNVIKYVLRSTKKGGLEDLKKARWYLDRFIEQNDHN